MAKATRCLFVWPSGMPVTLGKRQPGSNMCVSMYSTEARTYWSQPKYLTCIQSLARLSPDIPGRDNNACLLGLSISHCGALNILDIQDAAGAVRKSLHGIVLSLFVAGHHVHGQVSEGLAVPKNAEKWSESPK